MCLVPQTVAPRVELVVDATFRAMAHGSSFHAPSATPSESITTRFASCTTSAGRSAYRSSVANAAIRCASVLAIHALLFLRANLRALARARAALYSLNGMMECARRERDGI